MSKLKIFWTSLSILIFTLALLPLPTGLAAGPDGTVDPTFKSGSGVNSSVDSLAIQSDGKILIGGAFTNHAGGGRNRIARLNPDGSLDTTFNPGTGADNIVHSVIILNDGKILISGVFTTYNGVSRNRIARLNADGSLDTTFNPGTGANQIVYRLAVQNDGKILIAGIFTTYNGVTQNRIARLNSNGTLDTSFNSGTAADNTVNSLKLQADGKILIGGWFTTYNGVARNRIARLNSDGTLDTTFNPGTGLNDIMQTLSIQNDGKILIGGLFTTYNGTARNRIARVNEDGTLDTSFNVGTGASDNVFGFGIQSDGKIIIGGAFTTYNGISRNRIARLNSEGSLDNTFNVGTGANNTVFIPQVQSDGKILLTGTFTSYNSLISNRIGRLNDDGSLDTAFNPNAGADSNVSSLAIQNDGKIIVGGGFTSYNGISRNRIARLNPDGSLDTSFNPGMGANSNVSSLAIQNDGKIIIAGGFTSYNGTSRNFVTRLNPDGSLDTSFNPGMGANSNVSSLAIQNDGKILIGGFFTAYNGSTRYSIARINSDGSLDTGFMGSGANGTVYGMAVQSDGKIIIGGDFGTYNGIGRNRIARINSDGSLDTSFMGIGVNGTVYSIILGADNKIIIGGTFITYNGTDRYRVARINNDGSVDTSFNPGSGAYGGVYSMVAQSDGKTIIAGEFTTYNGVSRNKIAKLNANGSLDTSFNPGSGANDTINTIALQNDGKILAGGYFSAVDNHMRGYVARLENTVKASTSLALTSNPNQSEYLQNVTFTATLTPVTATGTVIFTFGTGGNKTNVTSTLTNGVASYMTSTLPIGENPVQASYGGATTFLPSTSSVYTQTVTKIATSLSVTSSPNPSPFGQTATFTATVSPAAASGLVTFTIGAVSVNTTLSNGVATYVTNTLASGSYAVSASYGGSPTYSSSTTTGQYTHTVSLPVPGTIRWESATYTVGEAGGSAILTATRTGGSDGAVSATVVITEGTATAADYSTPNSFVLSWADGESGAKTFLLPIINDTVYEGDESLTLGLANLTDGAIAGNPVTATLSIVEDDLPPCNPQLVTSTSDDGKATVCGTFSFALASTTSGTINFALVGGGNTITFTDSLVPMLKTGVAINGGDAGNGIALDGNGVAGDGLRLGGNNQLTNLTVRNFAGRELLATVGSAANKLFKVKVQS